MRACPCVCVCGVRACDIHDHSSTHITASIMSDTLAMITQLEVLMDSCESLQSKKRRFSAHPSSLSSLLKPKKRRFSPPIKSVFQALDHQEAFQFGHREHVTADESFSLNQAKTSKHDIDDEYDPELTIPDHLRLELLVENLKARIHRKSSKITEELSEKNKALREASVRSQIAKAHWLYCQHEELQLRVDIATHQNVLAAGRECLGAIDTQVKQYEAHDEVKTLLPIDERLQSLEALGCMFDLGLVSSKLAALVDTIPTGTVESSCIDFTGDSD